MGAFGFRKPQDLPRMIPIFPLPGALLLPRTELPLNIFEPRYLNMVDDALSSVDTATEREVLGHLREFFAERTTILVAQLLSTVREAELIIVVDEGRIVEAGDHDTLLARGGLYTDLFRQQAVAAELEAI